MIINPQKFFFPLLISISMVLSRNVVVKQESLNNISAQKSLKIPATTKENITPMSFLIEIENMANHNDNSLLHARKIFTNTCKMFEKEKHQQEIYNTEEMSEITEFAKTMCQSTLEKIETNNANEAFDHLKELLKITKKSHQAKTHSNISIEEKAKANEILKKLLPKQLEHMEKPTSGIERNFEAIVQTILDAKSPNELFARTFLYKLVELINGKVANHDRIKRNNDGYGVMIIIVVFLIIATAMGTKAAIFLTAFCAFTYLCLEFMSGHGH